MINYEPQETVHQCMVHLLIDFLELGLHEHNTLVVLDIPDVRQVIDSLAPLVCEERWRLGVRWLDPVGEQVSLLCLIP